MQEAQVPPEGMARKKRTQLSDFFLFFLSQTFWRKKMQILKEDEKSSEIFDSYNKRENSLLTNASHCLMLACKEMEHKL